MADHLYDTIRAMPKIELHRHLEGSVRLETLVEIAQTYRLAFPHTIEGLRPYVQMMPTEAATAGNFLAKFSALRQFFRSTDVIARITREAVIDAALDNIRYMELRFTPKALSNQINIPHEEVVAIVCESAAAAASERDIEVRLIVSMNRHESLSIGESAGRAAIRHCDQGVVGLDLAGIETGYAAHPFRHIFAEAREAGLGVTLHAGEWQGAQSVWDAVGNVGADRIGHGIRSLEDRGVVNVLVERQIALEVCPTSNLHSGVVNDLVSHPIPRLMLEQVPVTINTDDPLVSDITLTDELVRCMTDMDLTLDDIKRQTLVAAQSAFLPRDEQQALVERFRQWLYPPADESTPLQ